MATKIAYFFLALNLNAKIISMSWRLVDSWSEDSSWNVSLDQSVFLPPEKNENKNKHLKQ
ncbi:hypothetical protein DERF_001447 [Dermatophagoides farinae]|uniref:Uncharacterized protein n=1 Tax=Dermatophagoides farinae TaxID=6954 RepID=A0A922IF00_DERFA|nr:hypothetical protein DERF_001447 [Dermatophagoides farinae]